MHEKSLKRAIFTRFSNINEIKNQPFAETKSAKTKSATTKSTETLRAQRRRQIERSRQWTKGEQEIPLVNERARVKVKSLRVKRLRELQSERVGVREWEWRRHDF